MVTASESVPGPKEEAQDDGVSVYAGLVGRAGLRPFVRTGGVGPSAARTTPHVRREGSGEPRARPARAGARTGEELRRPRPRQSRPAGRTGPDRRPSIHDGRVG